MVHYKLTGFHFRGLGEISRLVLNYANVPFENERLKDGEWEKIKGSFLFNQLPALEIDGKTRLFQSCSIARYLARQHGLAGANDLESAYIDSISDFHKDVFSQITPFFAVSTGRIEGDKESLKRTVLIPALEKNMPIYEKLLNESGSGFFAKSGISWVDFFVSECFVNLEKMALDVLSNYPFSLEYIKRVHSVPQLKEYFENRPNTLY